MGSKTRTSSLHPFFKGRCENCRGIVSDIENCIILRALMSKQKLNILRVLTRGPLRATEVAEATNGYLSHTCANLNELKAYGIVDKEKDRRWLLLSKKLSITFENGVISIEGCPNLTRQNELAYKTM